MRVGYRCPLLCCDRKGLGLFKQLGYFDITFSPNSELSRTSWLSCRNAGVSVNAATEVLTFLVVSVFVAVAGLSDVFHIVFYILTCMKHEMLFDVLTEPPKHDKSLTLHFVTTHKCSMVIHSAKSVCRSVCLSLCPVWAVTIKSLDLETSFLVCSYIVRISVFIHQGHRSRSQKQKECLCACLGSYLKALALTYKLHFWYTGTSSEYLGHCRVSRSVGPDEGHRIKET